MHARKMFGFEIVRRIEHHHGSAEMKFVGDSDQPIIEIHRIKGEEYPGINHVAYVAEDIDAITRILKKKA